MKRIRRRSLAERRHQSAHAPDAGFTLVEVLLALTILSMVVVAVYSSFSLGADLRHRSRGRMADLQSVRELIATLRDDLHNLAPVDPNISLVGHDAVVLLRHGSPYQETATGTLAKVGYGIGEENDSGTAIIRREVAVTRTADLEGEASSTVPERGAVERRFDRVTSFRVDPLAVDGGVLVEAAPGASVDAVRIHVDVSDSGGFPVPDVVVWIVPLTEDR